MRIQNREPAMISQSDMSGFGNVSTAPGNAYAYGQVEKLSYDDMDDDMKEYYYEAQEAKSDRSSETATQTVKAQPATSKQLGLDKESSGPNRNIILAIAAAIGAIFYFNRD
jgi:hypothetical protein